MRRIEICGGIASGKTVLASLLESVGIHALYEDFTANPFWQPFYKNPGKYIFETETTFLLQHYHQIKVNEGQIVVCDFSFTLDRAYADIGLSGSKLVIFASIYEEIIGELGPPEFIIHLQCAPEIELQRISNRGRSTEDLITLDFLQSLNTSISTLITEQSRNVSTLAINSVHYDFAHSQQDRKTVLSQIQDWII